jgi:adenylate cyclase
VIMVSAVDDMAGVVRGIEMGAEDYLPKPVNPVLLRARINACLTRKRLHDLEIEYHQTVQRQAAELEELNRELSSRVQEQVEQLERLSRLRRFLSPQLAELVVSSGDETLLEGHRRQIAVMFCDLRGFTAFSETAAPEQVMGVLEEFHSTFGALVRRFEATVGFFAGDAIMVFFNDPIPCPDPAARAVRLACAVRSEMAGPLSGWQKLDYDLDFGIGIALGYATLGQMGFEGRYDYTAIGPVVNLAARLCDQARDGADVLIDQLAHAAVEDLVEAEPLGRFDLKGFARPRSAYRILGLRQPDTGR